MVRPPALPNRSSLHGGGSSCRVRSWSGDADRRPARAPAGAPVADPRRPAGVVRRPPPARASAGCAPVPLYARQAAALLPAGFEPPSSGWPCWSHRAPGRTWRLRRPGATDRMTPVEDESASAVDRRCASPAPYGRSTPAAIAEVRNGHPTPPGARAGPGGRPDSWRSPCPSATAGSPSCSGWPSTSAAPAQSVSGAGWCSTPGLHWAARRHAGRVLVNTHVDNVAALALYAATGFVRLPEQLVVLEHGRCGVARDHAGAAAQPVTIAVKGERPPAPRPTAHRRSSPCRPSAVLAARGAPRNGARPRLLPERRR